MLIILRLSLCFESKMKWFAANAVRDAIPFQDVIYNEAKLRTGFLKKEQFIVLGYKLASVKFMKSLLSAVTKDKHLLREGDLNLYDKMNYGTVERLCMPHLAKLLLQHVPGKEYSES